MPDVSARFTLVGLGAAVALSALIVAGSHSLRYFDPAVTGYAVATLVAAGALAWRFAVWLARPATRLFWQRGWQLVWDRRHLRHHAALPRTLVGNVMTQAFIWNRARLRWAMHVCLAWGCGTAFAITLPLVFGWVHFQAVGDDQYRLVAFGVPLVRFGVGSAAGWLLFNALNLSAMAVLVGCGIAAWLRCTDRQTRSYQQFLRDWVPILTLAVVSLTGLWLTIDAHWLGGRSYVAAAIAHELAVVFLLLYFPFSKLFHAVQRPAALGVHLYYRVAHGQGHQRCAACGRPFALALHVQDVERVLAEMGAGFCLPGGTRWQDRCPECRRVERARRFRALAGDCWV